MFVTSPLRGDGVCFKICVCLICLEQKWMANMDDLQQHLLSKYADRVTPEHRMAMEAIGMMRMILAQHRPQFEALLKSKDYMDNIGGLLDPTLYRDMLYSNSFTQQLRLVRAALDFLNAVDAVAKEIEMHDKTIIANNSVEA